MRNCFLMNYRIHHHNNVFVVTINGNIGRDDREQLLACAEEVKKARFQSAILFFQNVSAVEMAVYRELTLLQHEIRRKNRLRIVGLKGDLKDDLGERGVIRMNELIQDLKEILPK